ncbi:MAG: DUF3592 domain-containing protein [Lamprobacter sp.]|uniref:DUF3592 domain-containing protein n=1 Tax=Lamprobacter sp. TaxID=3100796 RepID=UPI002B258657|nr:DUF3592 domain-containing protein [Lamprobacter sp.]MEA3639659.1 DUF3592 domain-containing protein [Lamprobacter sp.]
MSDEKQMQALKARKVLRRFGLGLGALGALFSVFGIYFLFVASETLSWSSAPGTVVKTEVNTQYSLKKGSRATSDVRVYYNLLVHYTYAVAGRSYVSTRYSYGDGESASRRFRERADAEAEAASRFPGGAAVTVHYDPNNPAEAVLKAGWNWGAWAPLLIGLFLGGAGGLFYAVGGQSTKTSSESTV